MMATAHHGDDQDPNVQRFLNQVAGNAVREFPHGRVGGDDDGALSYAIATDQKHRIIRLQFPKPVVWLGLDIPTASQLRDELDRRIVELRTAGCE